MEAGGAISFQSLDDERRGVVADALHAAFEDDFGRRGVSRESAQSFFEQNFRAHNFLITLWDGNALVATAAYVRADKFYVTNVYVSPAFRGRGFARRAVAAAEAALVAAHDPRSVLLWCDKALVPLYEKMGYEKKTSNHQIARERFVEIMEKRLRH